MVIKAHGTIPQRISKGTGRLENKRENGDHQNYCIIKIVQNTEKSPGDFRRFAVTRIRVKKLSANASMKNSQKIRIINK